MVRVINYCDKYFDKLIDFCAKVWPSKSKEYLEYRLKIFCNNNDISFNLLVVDSKDNIVGCNLFFPTKVFLAGKIKNAYWSHDTFLQPEYRGEAGVDLIMRSFMCKEYFGAGLSDINKKIQRKLKTNFLTKCNKYYCFNAFFLIPFLWWRKTNYAFPNAAQSKHGTIFSLIKNPQNVIIYNGGFWNSDISPVDFIRDENFISKRFYNLFNKYYLFQSNDSSQNYPYFVLRLIKFKGYIPALSIVDYRFCLKEKDFFFEILSTVRHIAKTMHIPLIIFSYSHLNNFSSLFPLIIKRDEAMAKDIITRVPCTAISDSSLYPIVVTPADSDDDFCINN